MREASMSFFSADAAIITYACTFLIFYLHYKIKFNQSTTWKPLIQAVIFMFCIIVSLLRVVDNKHHLVDVVAGMIFGIISTVHVWYMLQQQQSRKINLRALMQSSKEIVPMYELK
jgi:membrane-associated phospholipid phosphatase